ncbi:MAG: carboxylate-amine ligase [Acidiferrobacterales bacterium]|nr:carboxylate-amine ligase [Acidiferrobacterales bacterium]
MNDPPEFTIGIEEEYLVVDIGTLNLVSKMPPALMEDCAKELGGQVAKELLQCQIEVGTNVCTSTQELRQELVRLRGTIAEIARRHDCLIMAASTHPFSFGTTQLTHDERYLDLAEQMQLIVRRLYISGMHVHAGIPNDELRIDLMNQASYILPHLLALSTSSPFWRGEDTGMKSYRVSVFDQLPRTGLPPQFHSYTDYMSHVNILVDLGIIEDATKIWWDLRPSWRYPTLESRLTDVCTNVEDAITVACVYRCWLRLLHRLRLQNQRWREYSAFLVQENRWRAQRYGIDRGLIDFGQRKIVDYPDLAEEIIELTAEDAQYFDCVKEVKNIRNIINRGTSAHRQLAIYNQSISEGRSNELALVDVVKFIVKETLVGVTD